MTPTWLSIALGLIAGLAVLALAIFVSVRPYVAAKPPKSRLADPSGKEDAYPYSGNDPNGFGSG